MDEFGNDLDSFDAIVSETRTLLEKGEYSKAFMNAQVLMNIDESKEVTYELFIKAAIGKEEWSGAMMGCYEAVEKFPDTELFKDLFRQIQIKRKEVEERPIIKNEALPPINPTWTIEAQDSNCDIILLNNNLFALFGEDGQVLITDGKQTSIEVNCKKPINSASLSPNGKSIAVGCQDGTIRIIQIDNGNITSAKVGTPREWIENITWVEEDGHQFLVFSIQKKFFIYEVAPSFELQFKSKIETHATAIQAIDYIPSRKELMTVSNKEVHFWNNLSSTEEKKPVVSYPYSAIYNCGVRPSKLKSFCLCVGARDGTVLFRVVGGKPDRFIGMTRSDNSNEPISAVHIAEIGDDLYLASANLAGNIEVYSVPNKSLKDSYSTGLLKAHRKGVTVISGHPTHPNIIASSSSDGLIYIWDLKGADKRTAIAKLGGGDGHIRKMEWTADGKGIIAGLTNGKVLYWNPELKLQ